jgi:hypothetical protein
LRKKIKRVIISFGFLSFLEGVLKMTLLNLTSVTLFLILSSVISTIIGGCSSSPKYIKSQFISNSLRTDQTPPWVLASETLMEHENSVIFVHKVYLSGQGRPDACLSMARTQAVGEMMKYIKTAITNSGQVEELSASSDPSFSSLTAYLSQGNISGTKIKNTYWEHTLEGDETGSKPIKKLMCAVQVAIQKETLERQMRDAINGTPGGNPEIRQKLIDAQKNFIDHVGKQE